MNLTLNQLLKNTKLDKNFLQAFADDLVILIQGVDLTTTMRQVATEYLKTIDSWCKENGLKLSELKTTTIIFRTVNKKFKFMPIILNNQTLRIAGEVKYLGVTFDKHLNWAPHIKIKCRTAVKLLNMCRNYVGKTWGINPKNMRWIYNQVVLPNLSYASFVWAHKVESTKYLQHMLERVQKLASLQITGGFKYIIRVLNRSNDI